MANRFLGALIATTLLVSSNVIATERFEWTTDSDEAKTLLTELQARIENFQSGTKTIALANKLVELDPKFAMGVYYLSAVQPGPQAQELLDESVTLAESASDGERRFIAAMVKARANGGANFAEAIPLLEKLATDYPQERLVRMILGQIYLGTGDAKRARGAFEAALAAGPASNRARSFIANDDLLRGHYAKARGAFTKIAEKLPEGSAPAPVRYGIAFSHLYEGNAESAVVELEKFLDEYRTSGANQGFPEVFILNSIARIHLENGDADKAMVAYEKGYKSIPDSGLPEDQKQVWFGRLRHGRCRTLAKMGDYDRAGEEAKALWAMIEQGGEPAQQYVPAYHYLEGYLALEQGKHKEAVEHLEQANPNDPFHTLLLARAKEQTGDKQGASEAYQSIVESSNNGLERALAFPEAKKKLSTM